MADVPLPLLMRSTGWLGNDGNWSTFDISIGTPGQSFNVAPSTAAGEIWVPLPEGCIASIPDCTSSRGVVSSQNGGFLNNESSTWDLIGPSGIYGLGFESSLFGNGEENNARYGKDVLSIINGSYNISEQTIAGLTTGNFWLGSIGLGLQPSAFGVKDDSSATLLSSLKSQKLISSLSYGYAVGSHTESSPGSLVLGGYDASAFTHNLSFPAFYSGARSLTVNLRGLSAQSTLKGAGLTFPVDAAGLNMSIDSTVSQMWLPENVCDEIADALGLTYDSQTELYTVNSTSHSQLVQKAPSLTFGLAVDGTTDDMLNIEIPWTALDLSYGAPLYDASSPQPYFPMRRAANASQYVLGRAFLQEAYIIVDWERMNFTLGQARHGTSSSNDIVPILPPSLASSPTGLPKATDGTGQSKSSGPGAGMYAGIAIGVIAVVAIAAGAAWYFWRRKRRQQRQQQTAVPTTDVTDYFSMEKDISKEPRDHIQEVPGSPPPGYKERMSPKPEMVRASFHELQAETRHHLMSTPVYELPGEVASYELGVHPNSSGVGFPFSPDVIEPDRHAP